jgi:hypothetical protein
MSWVVVAACGEVEVTSDAPSSDGAATPDGATTCMPPTPDLCGITCVDTETDPANCGACASAGGDTCTTGEMCVGGNCVSTTNCDGFNGPNSTVVPGWIERTGEFSIEGGRLITNANTGAYANHITRDGTMEADGCATANISYGTGVGYKAAGIVLRWTNVDSYAVALVQDNTMAMRFDSIWIYEYPGTTHLFGMANLDLGTDPSIRVEVVGPTVTIQADRERDGVFDYTFSADTTRLAPGLAGYMGVTSAAATGAFVDDFCACPP